MKRWPGLMTKHPVKDYTGSQASSQKPDKPWNQKYEEKITLSACRK